MKSLILIASALLSFASFAQEVNNLAISPVKAIEKSSYALDKLAQKKQIDPSYLTDIMTVTIEVVNSQYVLTMLAPSNDINNNNKLVMILDGSGKMVSATPTFIGKNEKSPIFSKISVATILDLGAETIVDHLSESTDMPVVAKTTKFLQIEATTSGPLLHFNLNDSRVYHVQMDNNGTVTKKGF